MTTSTVIPIANRAFRDSFIFHASQGNTIGLANLAQMKDERRNYRIPRDVMNAVFFRIQQFLASDKSSTSRDAFKMSVAGVLKPLSEIAPQSSSIFKVDALMTHIFSFLDIVEIATTANACHELHIKATEELTYVSNTKTSFTYRELVQCQKALHLDCVEEVFELFPEKTKSLAELDFSNSCITSKELYQLLSFVTNLTSIDLSCLSPKSIIEDISLERIARLCPRITNIKLRGRLNFPKVGFVESLVKEFPHLQKLDLSFCAALTDTCLRHLAQRYSQLTELRLIACNAITTPVVCEIIEKNTGLKSVSFLGCRNISFPLVIEALIEHCPNLESINPKLSDECIRKLARSCPKVNFTYLKTDKTFLEQQKLDRYRRELVYKPVSILGQLYCALLKEDVSESIINRVKESESLNRVYFHMWQLSGMPDELDWGRAHAFDEDKRDNLLFALETSIVERLNNLTPEDKNRVYGKVYALSADRDEADHRWGENHALDNIPRLADAL